MQKRPNNKVQYPGDGKYAREQDEQRKQICRLECRKSRLRSGSKVGEENRGGLKMMRQRRNGNDGGAAGQLHPTKKGTGRCQEQTDYHARGEKRKK